MAFLISPFGAAAFAQQAVEDSPIQVHMEAASGEEMFVFGSIDRPAVTDAGGTGKWTLIHGQLDRNSGTLSEIRDGAVPDGDDVPSRNAFFAAGTNGGVLMVDMERKIHVAEIVSYSWHSGGRAPQVFTVYGATGEEPDFSLPTADRHSLRDSRWTQIASVDTRTVSAGGGQHAARIFSRDKSLGEYRYLVFEVQNTNGRDPFSNTFFSEIDVLAVDAPVPKRITVPEKRLLQFASQDGMYRFSVDVTNALELEQWTTEELQPVVIEWYPKIVSMLPSAGFEAPKAVRFRFLPDAEMKGVPAYASGGTITLNREWFRGQLTGEAKGAVVHEMVHVVQGYQGRSHRSRSFSAPPGWIVEGIPDYVRWFLYEPETGGALLNPRLRRNARHDASYRVSANFIDWVIRTHATDDQLLQKLNSAAREGRYSTDTWKELTGLSESELAEAWRSQE